MRQIQIRVVIVYATFAVMLCFTVLRLFSASEGAPYVDAARQNGSYTLTVAESRGLIYDCKMRPLVCTTPNYLATIAPDPQTAAALSRLLPPQEMEEALARMGQGKPFMLSLSSYEEIPGAMIFRVPERYGSAQIAPHIIGYTDSDGITGVTGIERDYNTWLTSAPGEISVTYSVNAMGQPLMGLAPTVHNTMENEKQGVALTLDKDIQSIAEEMAARYLQKGAVVILDVQTGAVRACTSTPSFETLSVADYLDASGSPLLNRAYAAFDLGSVFKLVTAVAALEAGIDMDRRSTCEGGVMVGDVPFTCYHQIAHGEQNMEGALAHSCNIYFISLAQEVGAERLLAMAEKLGFGEEILLCQGQKSAAGVLPTVEDLKKPAALANFSFGQGNLLVTPVQVARLVQSIANDGLMCQPYLLEGLTDTTGSLIPQGERVAPVRVMRAETARKLRRMMAAPVLYGTGQDARPMMCDAGGKTATAETGITDGDRAVNQTWFAGFFPREEPRYAVAVLCEDSPKGNETSSPAFRSIADEITLRMR